MKYFQKILSSFVYSNLFIAGCAVAMVCQTYHLILQEPVNINFLLFVFFATLCSYSFHWYLTSESVLPSPRIDWVNKHRNIHFLLFITGVIGAGIFSLYLLPHWPWLLLVAIITFLYTAPKIAHPLFRSLRKVALGKTIFLAFVWMSVTTVLPIIISGQTWRPAFTLFTFSRFFLIYAICILFDYRDRQDDKAAGIRSLITYLSEKGITFLFIFSLLVFFTCSGLLYLYDYAELSILILLIPGIITACLYKYAKKNFADLFYYFVLDGLMAFSALVMIIAGI